MGYAARANARSFADLGKTKDPAAVAMARLIDHCQRSIKTPSEFDALLATMPPGARDLLRLDLRPYVTYDPARIKAEEDRAAAAALVVARMGGID